jgi:hypothetical protein
MAQTATLYLLEIKDLQSLQSSDSPKRKSLLGRLKKPAGTFESKLQEVAAEKINYRWSGTAFAVLAIFSKERLEVNWDNLEYSSIANDLSSSWEAGIYLFSIKDEGLLRLKPNGMFYSLQELDEFAIEFAGDKPGNPNIMKDAVGSLNNALSKLTKENVVLLAIV